MVLGFLWNSDGTPQIILLILLSSCSVVSLSNSLVHKFRSFLCTPKDWSIKYFAQDNQLNLIIQLEACHIKWKSITYPKPSSEIPHTYFKFFYIVPQIDILTKLLHFVTYLSSSSACSPQGNLQLVVIRFQGEILRAEIPQRRSTLLKYKEVSFHV